MAGTYLDTILDAHRARAARDTRAWRERMEHVTGRGPSFYDALTSDVRHVSVIAEVKRRSPSKGWLAEDLDPGDLATRYASGGCRAISVLTDEDFFSGSEADLELVRARVTVPILRKDFTVSANDVIDAAQMGASAVLLIVAALTDHELHQFLEVAHACRLDALVEVHDADECARALSAGARIVGVNQRDLRSFEVDHERAASIVRTLPPDVVAVAESGMSDLDDVRRVASAGADAILVGEAFVRSGDPSQLVREFASVERRARG